MSNKNLVSHFEKEIQKANEPAGAKERVWTPKKDDDYSKQTGLKVGKGTPPPKKSISQLP
ncbi:hypothetical protein PPL_09069 [Heterostelium album PN500]|uniref:Uncharacterized protein n=1 Tax=Heterostelium pallidum (strain ATCC 26659 / Pp 5 / PN500) TaxID=670386 RepID=D3BKI8_HETP5|nr:hypothetical protein PPL_09069 [Heterostelium album PN500]EFA78418.1 hypothetical protein PPL_09069 [Heterostelium album PN500]|eukprot:XP_020430543.1 hypothetical protein PPL_09069 [Heterostelium album PN500]